MSAIKRFESKKLQCFKEVMANCNPPLLFDNWEEFKEKEPLAYDQDKEWYYKYYIDEEMLESILSKHKRYLRKQWHLAWSMFTLSLPTSNIGRWKEWRDANGCLLLQGGGG